MGVQNGPSTVDSVADPLGFGAGDANWYRYVGNHPAGATDPSGLAAQVMLAPALGLSPDSPAVRATILSGNPAGGAAGPGSG